MQIQDSENNYLKKITINFADKIQFPFKYNKPVIEGSGTKGAFDEKFVDVPFVFSKDNKFYMMYTGYDGIGYQTALAVSEDLLDWKYLGMMLERNDDGHWDSYSIGGTWILKEHNNLYELPILKKVNGKYWLFYHAYPQYGFEEGSAKIGLAWCEEENLLHWNRQKEPILSPEEGEAWEQGGLYKSCIIHNEDTYYMFYNAKNKEREWLEQTGYAVSKDLIHWERGKENPILEVSAGQWDSRFVSDPYITKMNDIWINFYFGYDNTHAQGGLAVSKDLIYWEKYKSPILRVGSRTDIDGRHVHKASVIWYKDCFYYFYCAVREHMAGDKSFVLDEYRTISVATSKPLG